MGKDPRRIGLIGRAMDIDSDQGTVFVKNSKQAFVCKLGNKPTEVHVEGGVGGKVFKNKFVCPECGEVKMYDQQSDVRYCPIHDE